MKKQLVLFVFMLLSLAASANYSGKLGDNVSYIYEDGIKTITISGSGTMSLTFGEPYFKGEAEHLIVNEGVTNLSWGLFSGFTALKTVSLPSTMTDLGRETFMGCTSLQSIAIPANVKILELRLFHLCTNLTTVILPEGLEVIGAQVFMGCTNLKTVNFPNTLKQIDDQAFWECRSLTSLYIPAGLTSIAQNASAAFAYCGSLTSIEVEEGNPYYMTVEDCTGLVRCDPITYLHDFVRGYGSSIMLPEQVYGLQLYSLSGMPDLRDIYWYVTHDNLSMGALCFDGTDLTNTVLHVRGELLNSLKEKFADIGFKDIVALSDLSQPVEIDDICYLLDIDKRQAVLIANSAKKYSGTLTIPATVKFEGLTYKVVSVAPKAFEGCDELTAINVAADNTALSVPEGSNVVIETATGILLAGCATSTIPATVTTIGEGAFAGLTTLTSLSIPANISTIGADAFAGCTGLTAIECYAETVPTIGGGAFTGVTAKMKVLATLVDAYREALAAYEGITVVNFPEKIKTPTISCVGGKLKFSCETEGVTFHYKITAAATSQEATGDEVELKPVYQVSVYATKDDWIDSDEAVANVNALGLKGDVNGDGDVDIADAVTIVNYVVGKIDALSRPTKADVDTKEPQ